MRVSPGASTCWDVKCAPRRPGADKRALSWLNPGVCGSNCTAGSSLLHKFPARKQQHLHQIRHAWWRHCHLQSVRSLWCSLHTWSPLATTLQYSVLSDLKSASLIAACSWPLTNDSKTKGVGRQPAVREQATGHFSSMGNWGREGPHKHHPLYP